MMRMERVQVTAAQVGAGEAVRVHARMQVMPADPMQVPVHRP